MILNYNARKSLFTFYIFSHIKRIKNLKFLFQNDFYNRLDSLFKLLIDISFLYNIDYEKKYINDFLIKIIIKNKKARNKKEKKMMKKT